MKISLGSDHGGFKLKGSVKKYLLSLSHEVIDCGTFSEESCDYPDFAYQASLKVKNMEADRGIVICTTGEGVAITANKVQGIRCALVYNAEVARLTKEHNDANMIAIGAKYFTEKEVFEMIDAFLSATFLGERHLKRVTKISNIEEQENSNSSGNSW